jgi:hypothetical protein
MKILVYFVFRGESISQENLPLGVEGERVRLLSSDGLGAAFSAVGEASATPYLSAATAYARVIEAGHEACTVLPMRYGCLLDSREQICELLLRRRAEFLAGLDEAEGCVEMSLRILLSLPRGKIGTDPIFPDSCRGRKMGSVPIFAGPSGTAYLMSRKAHYSEMEDSAHRTEVIAQAVHEAFEGLFRNSKSERSRPGDSEMLSLHFLVGRQHVPAFREAFTRFQETVEQKILLTGPWPPYNFVHPALGGGH